jgi:hypothetical protein
MAARHLLEAPVFPRADQEAGTKGAAGNCERHVSILEGASWWKNRSKRHETTFPMRYNEI